MKIRHLILIIVLVISLGLAACTRSASESPTQAPDSGLQGEGYPEPPSNMETAVAGGGFATQTAQAGEGNQGQEAVATEAPTSEEPEVTEAPEEEPTAVPPTEQPTEAPAATGGGCTSPYIVQSGEWIWSIGRKCNILPQAIIDANNLACYYDLSGRLQCPVYSGTRLVLPANAPPFVGP
jgi:hypothetical protein